MIGLYDVPWDMSLPDLGIGITFDTFQIASVQQVDTESLERAVM